MWFIEYGTESEKQCLSVYRVLVHWLLIVVTHLVEIVLQFGIWIFSWARVRQWQRVLNVYHFCNITKSRNCQTTVNCCCSVTKWCPTLCDPTDCSTPGSPVLHYLLDFAQTHVHWVSDAIQPSHLLLPPFLPVLSLSQFLGYFPMSWLFASGGHSIGASASAAVLPMNIQGWFPLGLISFDYFIIDY